MAQPEAWSKPRYLCTDRYFLCTCRCNTPVVDTLKLFFMQSEVLVNPLRTERWRTPLTQTAELLLLLRANKPTVQPAVGWCPPGNHTACVTPCLCMLWWQHGSLILLLKDTKKMWKTSHYRLFSPPSSFTRTPSLMAEQLPRVYFPPLLANPLNCKPLYVWSNGTRCCPSGRLSPRTRHRRCPTRSPQRGISRRLKAVLGVVAEDWYLIKNQ